MPSNNKNIAIHALSSTCVEKTGGTCRIENNRSVVSENRNAWTHDRPGVSDIGFVRCLF